MGITLSTLKMIFWPKRVILIWSLVFLKLFITIKIKEISKKLL